MTTPEVAPAEPEPSDKDSPVSNKMLGEIGRRWASQLPDQPPAWRVDPAAELYEEEEDTGGGAGVIRVKRRDRAALERRQEQLRVTRQARKSGRGFASVRTLLLGEPIASSQQVHERLSKVKAMAILSSDPLSSVAYATEQTLAVLLLAGAGALSFSLPVGAAIVVLLIIVGLSYRQTIQAYPGGGGSYIVAKDNLGPGPGLVAAAALTTDYILTVAVSVSAGVQAVTSAYPELSGALVPIGLVIIGLMVMVNLRGVREAGTIFAAPTYLFIIAIFALIAFGTWHMVTQGTHTSIARTTNHLGSMLMNGTGAVLTTVVLVIAASTKFIYGAWVVVLLVPIMVLLFLAVHRHYAGAKRRVRPETPLTPGEVYPIAVVPVSDLSEPHLQALALSRRIADKVVAVFISDSPEKIAEIRAKWEAWGGQVPLEVIESPYRSLIRPFLEYLDAVEAQYPNATIMVVLPELVYGKWWHQFLHNQTALRLKAALLFRPGTVVVNVPYHLQEP